MTDIIKHVTSLELSKELKEAGVPQNSCFYWIKNSRGESKVVSERTVPGGISTHFYEVLCSAFLASEIYNMLPVQALDGDVVGYIPTQFSIYKQDVGCYCVYKNVSEGSEVDSDEDLYECVADTLADCIAKMLLYLIKEGLIDVESL